MEKNGVGENIFLEGERAWSFNDEEVVKNFPTHLGRSIPDYHEGHNLIVHLSDFFLGPHSTCYELGISLGTLLKKLAEHHALRGRGPVKFIGVDQSPKMMEWAQKDIKSSGLQNIHLLTCGLNDLNFEPSNYIVSYYTLQFMAPHERGILLKNIYESLRKGGAFVFFEKIRGSNSYFQDILTLLYQEYKLKQGYNPSEILAKGQSLKGILTAFSIEENIDLLQSVGFKNIQPIFQKICFQGLLAIK